MEQYRIGITHNVIIPDLDTAMKAQFGADILGISSNNGQWVEVIFAGTPTSQQLIDANAVLSAHDPAIITSDKLTIDNTGSDIATVTIDLPANVGSVASIVATIEGISTNPLTLTNDSVTLEVDGLDLVDGDTIEIGVVGFAHDVISIEVTS